MPAETEALFPGWAPDAELLPPPLWEATPPAPAKPRFQVIDRRQTFWQVVDVEALINEDHAARAIWNVVGKLSLQSFSEQARAVEGMAGRPAVDPQLLVSLWIYGYSQGIGSARQIAQLCVYHPAYRWLTGAQEISAHTLSSFRVEHQSALNELFVEAVGVLSAEGFVEMKRVMHDGTKVQADAAKDSYRRRETLEEHLQKAREQCAQLAQTGDEESEESLVQIEARKRGAAERAGRLEAAVETILKLGTDWKPEPGAASPAPAESSREPEAESQRATEPNSEPDVISGVKSGEASETRMPEVQTSEAKNESNSNPDKPVSAESQDTKHSVTQPASEPKESKPKNKSKEDKEPRVSATDPDARMMKQANGGYALCYNVQVTTSAVGKAVLSLAVTQAGNDFEQLTPALQRLKDDLHCKPEQAVVDAGYVSQLNIVDTATFGVELIGPVITTEHKQAQCYERSGVKAEFHADQFRFDAAENCFYCPKGVRLAPQGKTKSELVVIQKYQAKARDCAACPSKPDCCPKNQRYGRSVQRSEYHQQIETYQKNMATPEKKAIYRQRSEVAETPHLWMKAKFGLSRFHVRGLWKVGQEALWAALTYNVLLLLRYRRKAVGAA